MLIIIGLGNPTKKYENTWHNLGYKVVDKLAEKYSMIFKAGKGEYYSASGFINLTKILLVKPTTYMNNSGNAVRQVLEYYNESIDNILVCYDDIDLDFGDIRIRMQGSGGGHNGIKSINNVLATREYKRLRVGFKTTGIEKVLNYNRGKLPDLVLSQIPTILQEKLTDVIDNSVECIETLIIEGTERAMNKFNTRRSEPDK